MPVLIEGQRVRLTRPVERFPHFVAPAGATGRVTVADENSICIRLDEHLAGAEEWDNEVVFSADADEYAEANDSVAILEQAHAE